MSAPEVREDDGKVVDAEAGGRAGDDELDDDAFVEARAHSPESEVNPVDRSRGDRRIGNVTITPTIMGMLAESGYGVEELVQVPVGESRTPTTLFYLMHNPATGQRLVVFSPVRDVDAGDGGYKSPLLSEALDQYQKIVNRGDELAQRLAGVPFFIPVSEVGHAAFSKTPRAHWVLLCCDGKPKSSIHFIDSRAWLGYRLGAMRSAIKERLGRSLESHYLSVQWNGFDCGRHVIQSMQRTIRGERLDGITDMESYDADCQRFYTKGSAASVLEDKITLVQLDSGAAAAATESTETAKLTWRDRVRIALGAAKSVISAASKKVFGTAYLFHKSIKGVRVDFPTATSTKKIAGQLGVRKQRRNRRRADSSRSTAGPASTVSAPAAAPPTSAAESAVAAVASDADDVGATVGMSHGGGAGSASDE